MVLFDNLLTNCFNALKKNNAFSGTLEFNFVENALRAKTLFWNTFCQERIRQNFVRSVCVTAKTQVGTVFSCRVAFLGNSKTHLVQFDGRGFGVFKNAFAQICSVNMSFGCDNAFGTNLFDRCAFSCFKRIWHTFVRSVSVVTS